MLDTADDFFALKIMRMSGVVPRSTSFRQSFTEGELYNGEAPKSFSKSGVGEGQSDIACQGVDPFFEFRKTTNDFVPFGIVSEDHRFHLCVITA